MFETTNQFLNVATPPVPTNRWGHQSLAPKLRLPSELSGDNVRAQVNSESEWRPGGSHAPGMLGEWETIWETIG